MEGGNKKIEKSIISQNPNSTVIAEFVPRKSRKKSYQSEAELEKEFIQILQSQGYEYLDIKSEQDLVVNLRKQIEKLNNYQFSDKEWDKFFKEEIANKNYGIEEKTKTIQEDYIKTIIRDNGEIGNIYLLDKKNVHKNTLQVINQYESDAGTAKNRYDVTILVNGLPLVHIELKRRGVSIQEAFNQIQRYQRESFWAASGLFEYVQIFVISNGTHTKYYSNTTRLAHLEELNRRKSKKRRFTSYSFEFTNWWADEKNKPILDLEDFARTFFAKHTLLNILTKYCVFTVDKQLLVMRPYQIVATEKILNKIEIAHNYKKYGSIQAGGYIWHTTGSGKTLTSFKTAQLATRLPYIEKVLFVVDRKDLDYQTMREYDKFEKGAANSNTSTAVLKKQLEDPKAKVIITTIQKLDRFIKQNRGHAIFDGEVVLIFDECHRSQFGDMHRAITKAFKKYYLFGFTGTPIFAQNAGAGKYIDLKTTEQAFGEQLHAYTIVDAIADKNVLPFKVNYVSTVKTKDIQKAENEEVPGIDTQAVLQDPRRIRGVVEYILEHFDQKTKRNKFYKLKEKRVSGFNALFAVSSIDMAKRYYEEFKRQMKDLPSDKQLKIATIFSYAANEEEPDGTMDENPEDTSLLDKTSKEFLAHAIEDYNRMFGTNFDVSSERFQNYYKDVSRRVKEKELDLLIVVNMFLTGFDAPALNTLWVDKNLRYHGLIQAYSRTNRILNSIKTFGNIVCFRNLEKATNEAIALFGNKDAKGIVLVKTFDEYYNGYEERGEKVVGYKELVELLKKEFSLGQRIDSEEKKKEFVKLYGKFLRAYNILSTFDEFEGKEILSPREMQDYHSIYIDLYHEFRKTEDAEKEFINDELEFEIELIKQVEINIDYILYLIKTYQESHQKNREILLDIERAINSSIELRKKKDLIEAFVKSLRPSDDVDREWEKFVESKKKKELERIINEEGLDKKKTYKLIEDAFRAGEVSVIEPYIVEILPPISMFARNKQGESVRMKKKKTVLERIKIFFERFIDIASGKFN